MKTKLQILTVIFAFASLTIASAQTSPPVTIDPATGMPAANPDDLLMDPGWKDPAKVIASVNFDNGLPVTEVAHYLSDQFTNAFDIIMPPSYALPDGSTIDLSNYGVSLQLRNVTASEIFRAMNIEFEIARTPLRWELKMNGNRPTALLNIIPDLLPQPQPSRRMVFYLGDLNGMSTDGVLKTIAKVWEVAGVRPPSLDGHLEIYAPAQLLIVNGTQDQLDLTQQTIKALKLKVESDSLKPKIEESKPENSSPSK